jgi:hypothetical protein
VLVVVLACAVIAIAAVAQAAPASPPPRSAPAQSSVTSPVGPAGVAAAYPAPTPAADSGSASGASALQVVTGVVASTTAVAVGPDDQPDYQGTEPAYMTVSRSGSQVTVTVVPR